DVAYPYGVRAAIRAVSPRVDDSGGEGLVREIRGGFRIANAAIEVAHHLRRVAAVEDREFVRSTCGQQLVVAALHVLSLSPQMPLRVASPVCDTVARGAPDP